MRTDTQKEWTDAFRESFPEEVRPADGGWEAVAGRLRRAAARRRAAIAAAALALPLAGGVFFLNHHDSGESRIEVRETPGLVAQVPEQSDDLTNDTPVLSESRSEHNGMMNESSVLRNANSEHGGTANEPPVLRNANSEHSSMANESSVLSESRSEHSGMTNELSVLRNANSEHGGTAKESSVLSEARFEHGDMSNEHSVLSESRSEHSGMTSESSVLRNANSEHGGTANEHSVLQNANSEHGGTANEPPVLSEADPEHISADFSDVEEAMPARRAHRLTAGISAASMADGAPTTVTVSSLAGGLVTKSSNVASNSFLNNSKGVIMQKEYVHDLPLSFGLNARYWLSDRLSVESGLEYSYLHSRLDDIHTVMHFAGIPLRVDYSLFNAGPVEFYTGIGGKVEKCLKASLGGMRVKERDLQWSGSFNVGARSRLSKNAWIYFQPDISYYFTRTNLTSYRTENRLGLNLRAGILFDINH
ncbi:MAG: hypothetical protein IKO24_02060 [Bacteroidales bacterium]|nr:hypothetical protein [Bacteroidales bacterium]